MEENKLLDGKKILVVDDEQDVLESLEELLPMCEVLPGAFRLGASGQVRRRAAEPCPSGAGTPLSAVQTDRRRMTDELRNG